MHMILPVQFSQSYKQKHCSRCILFSTVICEKIEYYYIAAFSCRKSNHFGSTMNNSLFFDRRLVLAKAAIRKIWAPYIKQSMAPWVLWIGYKCPSWENSFIMIFMDYVQFQHHFIYIVGPHYVSVSHYFRPISPGPRQQYHL